MSDIRFLAVAILLSSLALSAAIWFSAGPKARYVPVVGKEYIFIIDSATGKSAGQVKVY